MSVPTLETTRLGQESNGMLMTPEEFDAVEEVDRAYRYELVGGVLIANPLPVESERAANDLLGHLLLEYRKRHRRGGAMEATLYDEHLRVFSDRRIADRAIWTGPGRHPIPMLDPPTIAIEFLTRRTWKRRRDYVEKRREYAAAGVREYWIVDRFRRRMTACRADASEEIIPETGVYRTDLLPGFELSLSQLLDAADRWKDMEEAEA